jgi:hypothetical protein
MKLNLDELNEIIYALGVSEYKGMFVNKDVNLSAGEKIRQMASELIKEHESIRRTTEHTEVSKEIEQLTKATTKTITPITDTGSEVADFLIAAAAEIPEPEESTEEVVETVKKAKFPGAKKSNLMDPEK